jgi:hypothetical protein
VTGIRKGEWYMVSMNHNGKRGTKGEGMNEKERERGSRTMGEGRKRANGAREKSMRKRDRERGEKGREWCSGRMNENVKMWYKGEGDEKERWRK